MVHILDPLKSSLSLVYVPLEMLSGLIKVSQLCLLDASVIDHETQLVGYHFADLCIELFSLEAVKVLLLFFCRLHIRGVQVTL